MEKQIKNISLALLNFQKEMPSVKKGDDNPFFKSKYASLESILPVIIPLLTKNGLTFTQIPTGDCELKTILFHPESGETIKGQYFMKPSKDDPQGRGAAITYARRFALVAMLGLNLDEDDDGTTASQKPKTAVRATKTEDLGKCTICGEGAAKNPKNNTLFCPNWKIHKEEGEKWDIDTSGVDINSIVY